MMLAENLHEDKKTTLSHGRLGWVVCFLCLFANFSCGGPALAYGIILPALNDYFEEGVFIISLVGSVFMAIGFAVGPIAAYMTNKIGLRLVYILGSFIFSVSIISATFSPNPLMLLLTYGVLAGIGSGILLLPATVGCNFYFETKRAFANGIAKTGISLGIFVYPPMTNFVLERYDWKAVGYLYAAIIFLGCFLGILIKPPAPVEIGKTEDRIDYESERKAKSFELPISSKKSIWCKSPLLLFTLHRMIANFSLPIFFMFLPILLMDLGFTLEDASFMVMVSGITNTISRFVSGFIMDHPRLNKFLFISIGLFLQAIILFLYPFCDQYIVLMIFSGLSGALIAPFQIGMAIIVGEMLPVEKVASVCGIISLAQGVGSMVGPPLAGFIYDHAKNHIIIFFIVGLGYVCSGVSCWLSGYLYYRCKKIDQKEAI